MNIKPMLARFQSAVGRDDLVEQMILLSGKKPSVLPTSKSPNSLTFVVGYNGSPSSHTALDITLLIAHQTRLATNKEVIVKIVYVIDEEGYDKVGYLPMNCTVANNSWEFSTASVLKSVTTELAKTKVKALAMSDRQTSTKTRSVQTTCSPNSVFEIAEQILWQARYLVEEWGDAFIAHLRIGCVAEELTKVVTSEGADLLFLGCHSANHSLVKKLGAKFPCPVLGIPNSIAEN
ncbi:universal stress protein [Aerosakkonemataceae cyanobacterium BLCC-F154]|uniref:Universal stress protein n=1 Tax=Floridaenema fluviatile BLCC-F154 TaxID=3153640 RepID=A0ABV4YEI2_9CYAN